MFGEISKSNQVAIINKKDDSTAMMIHISKIKHFGSDFVEIIGKCLERVKVTSLNTEDFTNSSYYLDHGLIL